MSATCIFWHSQPPLCGVGGPWRDAGQALGTCAGTAVASGLLLAPRCCQRPRTLQAFPEHRPVPLVLASPKLLARGCLLGAVCPATSSPGTSGQSVQDSDCLACGLLAGAPRSQKRPSPGVAIQAVPRRGGQAGVRSVCPPWAAGVSSGWGEAAREGGSGGCCCQNGKAILCPQVLLPVRRTRAHRSADQDYAEGGKNQPEGPWLLASWEGGCSLVAPTQVSWA